MSYGIAAGWDEDFLADGQGFVPAERVSDARDGRRPRELRPGALTKATELLWRVNDAQRAARVQAALESPEEEDEEMLPATGDRRENDKAPVLAAETVAVASSEALVRELGPSRASARAGLLAVPVASVDGHFQVRLLRTGQTQRSRCQEHVVDPEAVGLLQAQVDSGLSSPTPSAPRERAKLSPAQLSPVGAEATVLLQKYSQVAVNCFGEVGVEAFQLAEALFGVQDELQKMRRLSRWLSCVNQKTVRKYLEARGPRDRGAQGLDAVFHHLTANNVPAAVKELHRLPRGPHFDRLAPLLAAAGGCPLPSPQRRSLRQQLVEWKRQRVGELMNPELWRIYCLLAGDLEVIREALDWRTAFGVVFWYGQSEEPVRGSTGVLSQVVTSFVEAVKQQGISSRIRPVPSYGCLPLRETKDDLLFTELIKPAAIGKRNDPESLQFTAIRMAAGLAAGSCDVAHFDYKTYTKDPLEISLSWHFSVLMLALQGEEARAASNGVAFQRLTQQYCKLLEQNALHQWAVYVAHFLSEDRSRSALVRQLLTGYAKSISVVDEVMPWPSLPPGWLWQAKALACEQARNWCGALCCWLRCGNEEARAVSIACGYLMGPTLLGHASAPFKRGSVEAILLSPMNPAARWLLASLEELQGAMTGQDLLWAEAGREALELLRTWATSSEDARFVPQQLVRLHWKCQRLRGCMLGFPQ